MTPRFFFDAWKAPLVLLASTPMGAKWLTLACLVPFITMANQGCTQPELPARSQSVASPSSEVTQTAESGEAASEPTPQKAAEPPDACVPDCGTRKCGDDGCGGRCGRCRAGEACAEEVGRCLPCPGGDCGCEPHCGDKLCGDDGCGGSCGRCGEGTSCSSAGQCRPPAVCGNGMVEDGEECDGGDFCGPNCKQLTREQSACLVAAKSKADAECEMCNCLECTDASINCLLSDDATRNAACKAITECGYANRCNNLECVCGPGMCQPANGPCRDVITMELGTSNPIELARCYRDTDCAASRAQALGDCSRFRCTKECKIAEFEGPQPSM